VLWSVQRAPFQNSANGTRVPAVSIRYPTAVHFPLDQHDTPCSTLAVAPAGIGVGWIDQRRPFQRSANVTRTSADLAKNPTAVHAVGDAQDTAKRCPVGTEGSDTGWIDHAEAAANCGSARYAVAITHATNTHTHTKYSRATALCCGAALATRRFRVRVSRIRAIVRLSADLIGP
jgi:hypothetical protein